MSNSLWHHDMCVTIFILRYINHTRVLLSITALITIHTNHIYHYLAYDSISSLSYYYYYYQWLMIVILCVAVPYVAYACATIALIMITCVCISFTGTRCLGYHNIHTYIGNDNIITSYIHSITRHCYANNNHHLHSVTLSYAR